MQHETQTLSLADRLIPWYFVLFFVILTILLGCFAWLAVSSFTGVVTENAYQEGLKYNTIIKQAQKQEALGWKADMKIKQSHKLTISVTLHNKKGSAIHDAKAKLMLQRPTQSGYDMIIPLHETSRGVYSADIILPLQGIWDIYASFALQNQQFQIKKTYITNP